MSWQCTFFGHAWVDVEHYEHGGQIDTSQWQCQRCSHCQQVRHSTTDISVGWSTGYPSYHMGIPSKDSKAPSRRQIKPPPAPPAWVWEPSNAGPLTVADMRRMGIPLPVPTKPEPLVNGLTEKERGTL